MELENYSLKMKQNYIKNNIIQFKWDPQEVIDFLSQQKQEGSDLKNWNMKELIDSLELFKQQQNVKKSNQLQTKLQNCGFDMSLCELNEFALFQFISNDPQKKELVYQYLENNQQIVIPYKELDKLRTSLQSELPLKVLPPLKANSNQFYFYQEFLRHIQNDIIIQKSKSFNIFINHIKNQQQKYDKQYTKITNRATIKNIESVQIVVQNQQIDQLQNYIKDYNKSLNDKYYHQNIFTDFLKISSQQEKVYFEVKKKMQQIYEFQNKISTQYEDIIKDINQLNENYNHFTQKFNFDVKVNDFFYLSKIKAVLMDQFTLNKEFSYQINDVFKNIVHYDKKFYQEFQSKTKEIIQINTDFMKKKQELNQEKQKVFLNKDLNKWDLDEIADVDINQLVNDFSWIEPFMLKQKTQSLNNTNYILNTQNSSFLWDILNTLCLINQWKQSKFIQAEQKQVEANNASIIEKIKTTDSIEEEKKSVLLVENLQELKEQIKQQSQTEQQISNEPIQEIVPS